MNKKRLLRQLKTLAAGNGLKLKNLRNSFARGKFVASTSTIYIEYDNPMAIIVKVFCHELSHAILANQGAHGGYHSSTTEKFPLVRQALVAEVAADDLAKQIMKQWWPELKFNRTYYRNRSSAESIRDIMKMYPGYRG